MARRAARALLRPRVVVTLGNTAARTLLGTTEGVTRLRGRTYPWREIVLVPTYHPAAVLRGGPSAMAEMRADLVRAKLALAGAGAPGDRDRHRRDEVGRRHPALGAALADLARPGDVLVLAGDLGAGKTAPRPGLRQGLGVTEPVTSPTFILARSLRGRLRLHHLDVYRLDHLQEAEDLGLAELVDDRGVTLIEWGDVIAPTLPAEHLEVRLAYGEADDHDPPGRRRDARGACGPARCAG